MQSVVLAPSELSTRVCHLVRAVSMLGDSSPPPPPPLSFSLNAFFRLTFASQRMGALTIHLTMSLWKCLLSLRTGICKGERRIFFSQCHTCFPYKPTGCHYSHPHPGWQRTLGSERLNESRQTAQHSHTQKNHAF